MCALEDELINHAINADGSTNYFLLSVIGILEDKMVSVKD